MHSQSQNLGKDVVGAHRQSHFSPAFFFLSRERRQALETLYAVCRVLDDAVDVGRPDVGAFLDGWRRVFIDRQPGNVDSFGLGELARRFLESAEKFEIPLNAMVDLIDKGVAVDLKQNRFQTAMDTEAYCYGVAGTVGLACLPIFGVPVNEGKLFAVRLGIAVQWVNTLRDVGVDAQMGRIYLPLDHLEQFGYTEGDLFARKNSPEFKALIRYEYDVAQGHFRRAWELIPEKYRKTLLPARIMGTIYQRLLEKIRKQGFPVLDQKIKLNTWEKLGAVWAELKHNL